MLACIRIESKLGRVYDCTTVVYNIVWILPNNIIAMKINYKVKDTNSRVKIFHTPSNIVCILWNIYLPIF